MSLSNLHRNSTEANKHTPKGFDLADNNSTLLRDERGQSRYIDNLVNERVENLVDGFNTPPTTTSGHLYVLIDNGSGTVNTDWQGANYNDIVRIQDGVWVNITPVNGYLVFNKTDEKYYKFGSLGWEEFGGSVVWGNITGTLSDQTDLQNALDLKLNIADAYGGKRYTLIKPNGTKEFYDNLIQVRSNWADGDTLHQFADETITFSSTINVPSINWNGNGFRITCNGTITVNGDFFLATGETVNITNLNLLFSGTSNTSYFFRLNGGSFNGNNSTDISSTANITVMRESGSSFFANVLSKNNSGTATVLSSSGGGAFFNIKAKGGVVGGGGIIFDSFFEDNFIDASGTFVNCYGSTLTSQMKSTGGSTLKLYKCYLEVKTAGTLSTYNFNTSGSGVLEMHDCTYIENQRRSFSIASSNCKFTNNKIYNYSGVGCLFNVASFEFNNNYVYTKNIAVTSNSSSTANLINNFIISEVANPIGFGNFKILGGTLQVLTAAQNYMLDNHEFLGVNFIGSTNPFISGGYQANAYRLTQNADHLGNVGLGLKSPYAKMTTSERDALTGVEKGYTIENTTTNFLQVYNGSTWKDLLDLT